jgi:tripartite-type tricarboxylate transporter receptor subunit TctC
MPGAGSIVAATHLYNVAKPDGLTIGAYIGDIPLGQLLGIQRIDVDFLKFGYLGVTLKDFNTCAFTKGSGVTSVEKWRASKVPIKMGSTAPGSSTDTLPKILRAVGGLPIQVVTGYKSTPEIRQAALGGEIAGACWSWGSMRILLKKELESGEMAVVLQNRAQPHPELPNVPLAVDLAKTAEGRELIQLGDPSHLIFTYATPPGTPSDRLQTLRRAFADTMKDPDFLKDAAKALLVIDPMSGEELENAVARILKMEPALVTKLKEILVSK